MARVGANRGGQTLRHGVLVALVAAATIGLNADFAAPPRFDGAGYAVLAESLRTGRGYREIDHPDAPRHAHFPPGYPLLLAGLWRLTGPSERAAHVFSATCVVAATVLGWAWFRGLYRPRVALALGLALAVNWTWTRAGGAIQSEPPYLLLQMAALLAARWTIRGGIGRGFLLGLPLGACILTRHVGLTLAAAIGLDLLIRRRVRTLAAVAIVAAGAVAPWAAWLASVRHHTQIGLIPTTGLAELIASQALFYVRRLPDAILGPVVEVGTVFRPALRVPVTIWAFSAAAVIGWGWLRALRSRRRRLVGLVPLTTLPLLLIWPFTEAGRFLIPLVPFALAGAFEGTRAALFAIRRRPTRWAAAIVLAASLPYPSHATLSRYSESERASHADFDAACRWLARRADRPGPVLTRQAGEAFWLMGRTRHALAPPESDAPEAIDRFIDRYDVAYLIVDEDRYARAPASPLGHHAGSRPDHARLVWERGAVAVYEVVP